MYRNSSHVLGTLPPHWFAKSFLVGFSYPTCEIYFRDAADNRVTAERIAWPIGKRGSRTLFVEVYDPEHRTVEVRSVLADNDRDAFDQLMIKLGVYLSGHHEDRYREEFFRAARGCRTYFEPLRRLVA